tara:strand:+ start:3621 stop:4130 length:510 start_codon:yes stop_codon:yes gene_type:complete
MPTASPHDIFLVKNITTEDFEIRWDRVPYLIKAGQTRSFPRFLASHFAIHLVDHIMNGHFDEATIADDTLGIRKWRLNNVETRKELETKIILGLTDDYKEKSKPTIKDEVEEMNKDVEEKFDGLEDEKDTKPLPTKAELLKMAEVKGLTVDAKMKKMKVKQLMDMLEDL